MANYNNPSDHKLLLFIRLGKDYDIPVSELFGIVCTETRIRIREISVGRLNEIQDTTLLHTIISERSHVHNGDINNIYGFFIGIAGAEWDHIRRFLLENDQVRTALQNSAKFLLLPQEIQRNQLPPYLNDFTPLEVGEILQGPIVLNACAQIKAVVKKRRLTRNFRVLVLYCEGSNVLEELANTRYPPNFVHTTVRRCDTGNPISGFLRQIDADMSQHDVVVPLITRDCFANKSFVHAIQLARTSQPPKQVALIHYAASCPFPGSQEIPSEIAITLIGQFSDSCWNKLNKRLHGGNQNIATDVFLSHKQSTGQGIALSLYNELTNKFKLNPFLDVKAKFNLHDLVQIVQNTKLFVMIITDGIFDSYWCMQELVAAIKANKPVMFVCHSSFQLTVDSPMILIKQIIHDNMQHVVIYNAVYAKDAANTIVKAIQQDPQIAPKVFRLSEEIQRGAFGRNKRLQNEWLKLLLEPVHGFTAEMSADFRQWTVKMIGPEGSPYQGGIFHLKLDFPEDHPFKAPQITFLTQVYHPYITPDGSYWTDILSTDGWSPQIFVRQILDNLQNEFRNIANLNPNWASNPDAGTLVRQNLQEFLRRAAEMTQQHARN
eukprot:CAMPEP_0168557112 /NCGR_PEP_ID=MMETSP0413-20121227/9243_1 /TAXON_ID=136452 /ORGANISM="Filamoeba nolandi, Strain NC-AS-23-1" /LENGTH=603 /DNA_ID=CAMNT_0008588105 /DNA_START=18 /DNA_END=1829 /DNA_ORIENTATION=-